MNKSTSNYQKYQTQNPVVRFLLTRFLSRLGREFLRTPALRVVDLGCGEGMVISHLASLGRPFEYRGLELNEKALTIARALQPNLRFEQGDIMQVKADAGWADVALCIEVLEHLPAPLLAVEKIRAWTKNTALVSVPWEPYFRLGNLLRGKYLPTLGNHPEHVQHFSPRSLKALLQPYFSSVRIIRAFPWLLAVAKV